MYTVCRRRTKGSYSVSLCKPDSSWIKYKHRGLARRQVAEAKLPMRFISGGLRAVHTQYLSGTKVRFENVYTARSLSIWTVAQI